MVEGINSPNGLLRPLHYYYKFWWVSDTMSSSLSPWDVELDAQERCPEGWFGVHSKSSSSNKTRFPVGLWQRSYRNRASCSLMLPFTGLDAFGGQITKKLLLHWDNKLKCSCITLMMLFLIFYSHSVFLHLGHIFLCPSQSSSSVPHSVVTFTYLYRKCYKAQPKNSVLLYIWLYESKNWFLWFFTHLLKKTPQILLCAASQCPSEDSDAAEELFWEFPAQFC